MKPEVSGGKEPGVEVYTVKVDEYGNRCWYQNDVLHRTDGPAIEWASGSKMWYVGGKRHRTDGPAVEWDNGTKYWWVEGKRLTKREFKELTQPPKKMTVSDIQAILGYKIEIVEG